MVCLLGKQTEPELHFEFTVKSQIENITNERNQSEEEKGRSSNQTA